MNRAVAIGLRDGPVAGDALVVAEQALPKYAGDTSPDSNASRENSSPAMSSSSISSRSFRCASAPISASSAGSSMSATFVAARFCP